MKKFGFTLAEVLVCLMILGMIGAVMLKNLKSQNFNEKAYIANAFKAIDFIDQAAIKITDIETNSAPTGSFMTNVTGTYEYTLMNEAGTNAANIADVVGLFGKYIKFENDNIDFCSHTTYCTSAGITDTSKIKGAKVPGDVYIGFELTGITNCPSFYLPNSTTISSAPTEYNSRTGAFQTAKCWGKVYIDVDGLKGPNTLGKDVFVYGLNGKGIAR